MKFNRVGFAVLWVSMATLSACGNKATQPPQGQLGQYSNYNPNPAPTTPIPNPAPILPPQPVPLPAPGGNTPLLQQTEAEIAQQVQLYSKVSYSFSGPASGREYDGQDNWQVQFRGSLMALTDQHAICGISHSRKACKACTSVYVIDLRDLDSSAISSGFDAVENAQVSLTARDGRAFAISSSSVDGKACGPGGFVTSDVEVPFTSQDIANQAVEAFKKAIDQSASPIK